MAQVVVVGDQAFKKRNIFAVWLLPWITLGIYRFVWYYKINDETRRYLRDPSINPAIAVLALLFGWLIIVPPLVSVYNTGKRIRRMEEAAGITQQVEPWIGVALIFAFGLFPLYHQMHLNAIWDAYLSVGTTPPPVHLSPLPPPGVPSTPPPPAPIAS